MSKIKELEKILKNEFMDELEENINEVLNILDKNPNNKDVKKDLEEFEDIQTYFNDVLLDITNNTLLEEDAIDILEILNELLEDNL